MPRFGNGSSESKPSAVICRSTKPRGDRRIRGGSAAPELQGRRRWPFPHCASMSVLGSSTERMCAWHEGEVVESQAIVSANAWQGGRVTTHAELDAADQAFWDGAGPEARFLASIEL